MNKRIIGFKTDFRNGEPGGNNIMIDGIVAELAATRSMTCDRSARQRATS